MKIPFYIRFFLWFKVPIYVPEYNSVRVYKRLFGKMYLVDQHFHFEEE